MRLSKWMITALVVCCTLPSLGQAPASVGPPASGVGIVGRILGKANAGDVAAQVAVGHCYAEGKGVARDYRQAAERYKKAAEKGDVAAWKTAHPRPEGTR